MSKTGLQSKLHRLVHRLTAMHTVLPVFALLVLAIFSKLLPDYESWWFGLFVTVLLGMVALAIWRYGRVIWRDAWQFRNKVTKKSLQALHQQRHWQFDKVPGQLSFKARQFLEQNGFKLRQHYQTDTILISAMKGRANRVGFLLVHTGFLLLCFGAILDSDMLLRYRIWQNEQHTVVVPRQEALPDLDGISFHGVISLQDGTETNQLAIRTAQGEFLHKLPFSLALQRVELVGGIRSLQDQYKTHLLINDTRRGQSDTVKLAINSPARYQGYDIYQQLISDAGTNLHLKVWPLFHSRMSALKISAKLKSQRELQTGKGPIRISFSEFTPRNVVTEQATQTEQWHYSNLGPKLVFTALMPDGQQQEHLLYMLPLQQQGRYFFLTGVRKGEDDSWQYLHIPADQQGDIRRFLQFHAILNDERILAEVVTKTVSRSNNSSDRQEMINTVLKMIKIFNHGGYAAMETEFAKYVSAEKLKPLLELTNKLMRNVFYQLYERVLQLEHGNRAGIASSFDIRFFDDAVTANAGLGHYGLPFFIQLDDFEYHPAVQLQISKKPGKGYFLTGCFILLIGLVLVLYTRHRRIWVLIDNGRQKGAVIVAGMGNRRTAAFADEFEALAPRLESALQEC